MADRATAEQIAEWSRLANSGDDVADWWYCVSGAFDGFQESLTELTAERTRSDAAEVKLAAIRDTAQGWATQPNDYDEDTEQQIQDGRAILAMIDGRENPDGVDPEVVTVDCIEGRVRSVLDDRQLLLTVGMRDGVQIGMRFDVLAADGTVYTACKVIWFQGELAVGRIFRELSTTWPTEGVKAGWVVREIRCYVATEHGIDLKKNADG